MKNVKKVMALTLACGMLVSGVACGQNNDKGTLKIEALDAGYGVQWLYDIVDAYKEANPDKSVEIVNTTPDDYTFITTLESGVTKTDIFFGREDMRKYMMSPTVIAGTTYKSMLADLTDLYESTVPGENVTVEKKFIQETLDVSCVEDDNGEKTYYTMPWVAGTDGFIYNKKVWKSEWKMPNTTNELLALCETIKSDDGGYTPMIYCLEDSYWYMLAYSWMSQYEGYEGYKAMFSGYDDNGERYTPEVLLTQGILEAYEVIESLIKESNGYTDSRSKEANFTLVQTYFLEPENKIAIMPNGDWIQREMSVNYSEDEIDVSCMKTPIISSIVETLEYRNGTDYMSDAMLSEVISAIDSGAESYDGVSANDFARLKEARSMYQGRSGHVAWVPVYSEEVDLAKDFLKYMTTDEAIRIFTTSTKGCTQPFNFDYKTDVTTAPFMKGFMLSAYDIRTNGLFMSSSTDRIFNVGGLKIFANEKRFENGFSASNSNDYFSAYDYYMSEYNYVKARWGNYLQLAGIGV